MDAMNVVPQPSPATLFTFVAPVAAGKAGVATAASPATESVFAGLFAKVAVAESSVVKGATGAEQEVSDGAKAEKDDKETEVSATTADLSQVALAVPVMAPATFAAPSVQKDAPKDHVQEGATPVTPAMPLPVQGQPASLTGPLMGAAVEAPAAGQIPGKQEAALTQQKAGGQEIAVAAPQKAGVAGIEDGSSTTPAPEAKVTVAVQTASAVPVETAVSEQVQPASAAAVAEPAVTGATVAATPAAEPEPVEVAVPVARPDDASMKVVADGVNVLPEQPVAPAETAKVEPTALPGTETVAANGGQAQGKAASHHGKAEHAMPEVAADRQTMAGKEASAASGKDQPVIKAAAEKAAFSPESGDKEAKSGNEEKNGANVSHNPLMGEAVKTAAVESVHKADGGRSATAENVLAQVKETLALHNPKEAKQITMTLNPAELGELKINVSMDGQQLKVHVVAENAMVKDVLLANIDTLKESLAKQNVTVERFNVSTGGNYSFNQPSGEEKWLPQRSSHHSYAAMGGMVADGEERQISYLNGPGTSLVDVRF